MLLPDQHYPYSALSLHSDPWLLFCPVLRTVFFGFINCLSCTITYETHSDITLPPFVTSWEVVLYSGAPRSALAVAHIFFLYTTVSLALVCQRWVEDHLPVD